MRTLSSTEIATVSGAGVLRTPLGLLEIDAVLRPAGWFKVRINLLLVAINLNIGWAVGVRDAELPSVVDQPDSATA